MEPKVALSVEIPVDTNLVVWLRADNLTFDSGNPNNVNVWHDLTNATTGFGDAVAQDASLFAGGPTIRNNEVNGNPSVDYGGGGEHRYSGGAIGLGPGFSAFIVGRNFGTAGNERAVQIGNITTGANGNSIGLDVTSGSGSTGAGTRYNNGNNQFTPGWEADDATYHVSMFSMADNSAYNSSIYALDGTAGTFQSSNGAANIATFTGANDTGYTMGRGVNNSGGVSDSLVGRIAEVLIFSDQLSAADQNAIGFYLQQRYGLSTAYTAPTADVFFDDLSPADSDWGTGANWDTAAQPDATQNAYINGGAATTVTLAGGTAGTLAIGSSSTGGPNTPGAGTLNVSSGDLTVGGLTSVGDGAGPFDGTVNVSGGTLNADGGLNFGTAGSGLYVTGGTVNITGNITGSQGTVDVRNAASTLTLIENGVAGNGGDILVGGGAILRLHSDVDVDWGQNIIVPNLSGGTDIYADPTTAGTTGVTHTLGDVTFQGGRDLRIYNTNPTDNHTVVFNNVTLSGTATRKGNADVVITGDIINTSTTNHFYFEDGTTTIEGNATLQSFRVGNAAGTTATVIYDAPGNTLENTGTFIVGTLGTGTFTMSGAGSELNVTNRLQLGDNNNGDGTFNLQDGTVNVAAGGLYIAGNGTGTSYATTQGDFNMTGGVVNVNGGNTEVGRGGTGTFTLTGGTFNQNAGNLVIAQGENSSGTVNINGGTLNITDGSGSNQDLNFNSGTGIFNHNGGDVIVERDIQLASQNVATSNSTYNLDAGTGSLSVGRHIFLGEQRDAVFNFESGGFSIGGTIYIGGNDGTSATANPNGNGTLNIGMLGGTPTMNTNQLEVGRHGIGVVNQDAGTVNVNSGNLVISQYANSDGTYNLSGGTVNVTNDLNFNQGTSELNITGGIVDVRKTLNHASGSGTSTINITGGTLIVANSIADRSGTSNIVMNGPGTIDMAYGGDAGGNITVDNLNGTSTGALINLGNGLLAVNNSSANSFAGQIAGTGGKFRKTGAGTLTLSGTNTYTGLTELRDGTTVITNASAFGGIGEVEMEANDPILELDANGMLITNSFFIRNEGAVKTIRLDRAGTNTGTISGPFRINEDNHGNFQVDIGVDDTLALTGDITTSAGGGAGIVKIGAGTLALSGANTYDGPTAIRNGAIQLSGGNNRLPNNSTVTLGNGGDSGKLILGDSSGSVTQTLGRLTTVGSGAANAVVGGHTSNSTLTLNIAGGTTNTYTGLLGGSGPNENNLTVQTAGDGTLVLDPPAANTFAGGFRLGDGGSSTWNGSAGNQHGFVVVHHSNALGTGDITSRGSQLQAGSTGIVIPNDITIDGGGMRVGGSIDYEISGLVTLVGAPRDLGQYGTNTVTLSGGIDLNNRELRFRGINNADNGAFVVNGITGNSNVVLNEDFDGGEVTLIGTSTYTGATTINTGTLQVGRAGNGSIVSQTTVNNGGTLAGTGWVNQSIDVESGGAVSPGDNSGAAIGTLNATGPVTFNPGSSLVIQLDPSSPGNFTPTGWGDVSEATASDTLNVTGQLTLAGTLDLRAIDDSWARGQEFNILDFDLAINDADGDGNIDTHFDEYIIPHFYSDDYTTITHDELISGQFLVDIDETGEGVGNMLNWDFTDLYSQGIIRVVPEPATWALFGLGLLALGVFRRRK